MKDEPAFTAFATSVGRPLYRSAWLLTGDHHRAEDLVQETLARMFRLWRRIDAIDNPAAYAQTVLVRTFLSQRRRRSSSELPLAETTEVVAASIDLELRHTLVAALQQLPATDRAVLVLRYLADRSVEQVAIDLDKSPGAVRVQAMRALAKLREQLGDSIFDLVTP